MVWLSCHLCGFKEKSDVSVSAVLQDKVQLIWIFLRAEQTQNKIKAPLQFVILSVQLNVWASLCRKASVLNLTLEGCFHFHCSKCKCALCLLKIGFIHYPTKNMTQSTLHFHKSKNLEHLFPRQLSCLCNTSYNTLIVSSASSMTAHCLGVRALASSLPMCSCRTDQTKDTTPQLQLQLVKCCCYLKKTLTLSVFLLPFSSPWVWTAGPAP